MPKSTRWIMALALSSICLFANHSVYASGWRLAFEDDFSGSSLDRSKWATRFIYGGETTDYLNDEIQRYRDNNNHFQHDGQLDLIARRTGQNTYESGMIRSIRTFYYGYFEARVFLPKGRGVWPAFWLNSDYDKDGKLSWPPEIDIFEYVINGLENTDDMVHSASSSGSKDISYRDKMFDPHWGNYRAERPLNEDWQVFGLAWSPDTISVFLNGKLLYAQKYKWVRAGGDLAAPAHIILNFAVGGKWAGKFGVDHDKFPQSLQIDYIRVCQFTREAFGSRQCGNSVVTPDPAVYGYDALYDDLEKASIGNAVVSPEGGRYSGASISPGTDLNVALQVTLPKNWQRNQSLLLGLRRRDGKSDYNLPAQAVSLEYVKPFASITYRIPINIPPGEYYLSAQIVPGGVDSSTSKLRAPIICESAFSNPGKALSCNIAKLKIAW